MDIDADMAKSEQCRRHFGDNIVSVGYAKRLKHTFIIRLSECLVAHARTAEHIRFDVFMRKVILDIHRAKHGECRAERVSRHGHAARTRRNQRVDLIPNALIGAKDSGVDTDICVFVVIRDDRFGKAKVVKPVDTRIRAAEGDADVPFFDADKAFGIGRFIRSTPSAEFRKHAAYRRAPSSSLAGFHYENRINARI